MRESETTVEPLNRWSESIEPISNLLVKARRREKGKNWAITETAIVVLQSSLRTWSGWSKEEGKKHTEYRLSLSVGRSCFDRLVPQKTLSCRQTSPDATDFFYGGGSGFIIRNHISWEAGEDPFSSRGVSTSTRGLFSDFPRRTIARRFLPVSMLSLNWVPAHLPGRRCCFHVGDGVSLSNHVNHSRFQTPG